MKWDRSPARWCRSVRPGIMSMWASTAGGGLREQMRAAESECGGSKGGRFQGSAASDFHGSAKIPDR